MEFGIKRILRISLLAVAGLLALALAAVGVLVQWPGLLLPSLEKALAPPGGQAEVEEIQLGLFPPRLSATRVRLASGPDGGWRLALGRLAVESSWPEILGDGRWLGRVKVEDPRLELTGQSMEQEGPVASEVDPAWLGLADRVKHLSVQGGDLALAAGQVGRFSLHDLALQPEPGQPGQWSFTAGLVLSAENGDQLAKAGLAGRVRLRPGPAVSAELTLSATASEISWLEGRLDGRFEAGLTLEASSQGLRPGLVILGGQELSLPPSGAALPEVKLSLSPQPKPDGSWAAQDLRLSLGDLPTLSGQGTWKQEGVQVELNASHWDLAQAASLLKPLTGWDPASWQLTGEIQPELSLTGSLDKLQPVLKAGFNGLGLASPDGLIMAGKLGGALSVYLGWGTEKGRPATASLDLALETGEALYSTLYFNLADTPLKLAMTGNPQGWDKWEQAKLSAEFKGFGRLEAQGQVAWPAGRPTFEGRLSISQASLAKMWSSLVRDPLALVNTDLAESSAKGMGRLEVTAQGRDGRFSLTGRLALNKAGLHLPAMGINLAGVELDMPLAYAWGKSKHIAKRPSQWGRLRLGSLSSPRLNLTGKELALALIPNRLVLKEPLALPVWGGQVVLRDLEVFAPLSPAWEARLGVAVRDLDLAQAATPLLPLEGRLRGDLKRVVVNPQRVAAQGSLRGSLFQGEVSVKDILVLRPWERGRELGADIDMHQLDLHQLSSALGIGLITGRINGFVHGLRVAYGQPVAFKAKVESVKIDDVEQKVSLKAVNSIAVLGTGSGLSGVGASLITSLMNEFPYEAIGFVCTLNNDQFQVNGLIHEDGVEYIVRKPFLAGINVINRNRENYISFQDMLERMRRVVQPRGKGQDEESS